MKGLHRGVYSRLNTLPRSMVGAKTQSIGLIPSPILNEAVSDFRGGHIRDNLSRGGN